MHVNERGRVQIRRARTRARARAHVSVRTRMRAKVWVHACEHGRGCPQHICDLHAQLEHRGLRSLQLRLELRGLALCNGELGFSSIVFLRELADVILHLRGDLDGLTGASNQHLVFGHSEVAMGMVFVTSVESSGEIMSTAPHCRVQLSCLLISPCAVHFSASCRSTIGDSIFGAFAAQYDAPLLYAVAGHDCGH